MEQKKSTKYILIAISVLFIFVMLILPLFSFQCIGKKDCFLHTGGHNRICARLFGHIVCNRDRGSCQYVFGIVAVWL